MLMLIFDCEEDEVLNIFTNLQNNFVECSMLWGFYNFCCKFYFRQGNNRMLFLFETDLSYDFSYILYFIVLMYTSEVKFCIEYFDFPDSFSEMISGLEQINIFDDLLPVNDLILY